MDDILPIIITVLGIIILLFVGLAIYALSFFTSLNYAIYIVVGATSLLLCALIFWLIPSVDNKDAIMMMRIMIIIVFFASLAVLIANVIKAFAIK